MGVGWILSWTDVDVWRFFFFLAGILGMLNMDMGLYMGFPNMVVIHGVSRCPDVILQGCYIWVFPKIVGKPNKPMGCFLLKMDHDLGCGMGKPTIFLETP